MAEILSKICNWIKSKLSKGGKIMLEFFKNISFLNFGTGNGNIIKLPEPAVIDIRSRRHKAEDWLDERGYSNDSLETKPHSSEIIKAFLEWIDNSKKLPENRVMAAKLKELENKYKGTKRRKR